MPGSARQGNIGRERDSLAKFVMHERARETKHRILTDRRRCSQRGEGGLNGTWVLVALGSAILAGGGAARMNWPISVSEQL